MNAREAHRRKIIGDAVAKNPDMPTATLARIMYNRHPAVWGTENAARQSVRWARGERKSGRGLTCSTPAKPSPLARIPQIPKSLAEPVLPFVIPHFVQNMLIVSDLHFPFHDEAAVKAQIEYGLDRKCDGILINGDLLDCYELSRFDKKPNGPRLKEELGMAFEYLYALRCAFADAPIYWKLGNHEVRLDAWLKRNAPIMWREQVDAWEWNFLGAPNGHDLTLKDLGVEIIADKRVVLFSDLKILHGHEYRAGFAEPVNPARGMFLRAKDTCLVGHWHQVSEHQERTLGDKFITCWSVGCACDLKPEYMPYNKWTHGVASVRRKMVSGRREMWVVENRKIIHGEVV